MLILGNNKHQKIITLNIQLKKLAEKSNRINPESTKKTRGKLVNGYRVKNKKKKRILKVKKWGKGQLNETL